MANCDAAKCERTAEFVLYCRCLSRRTRLQVCGAHVNSGVIRKSDFAFYNPDAQCDECGDDVEED